VRRWPALLPRTHGERAVTALHLAACVHSAAAVRVLLIRGAVPTQPAHGQTPLHCALYAALDRPAELRHLLGNAATRFVSSLVPYDGDTAKDAEQRIVEEKLLAVQGQLIDFGTAVDAADARGVRAVHLASMLGPAVLQPLVDAGCDLSVVSRCGRTCLHWVAGCRGTASSLDASLNILLAPSVKSCAIRSLLL
jgi:ankyrin repeat protein